jgi:uncharacterized protein
MTTMTQIRDLSRRIADQFRPDKIILFGSYATGHPTADSDVDLLVILPEAEQPVEAAARIRMALRTTFPLDVLVRTPDRIRERLAKGDDFIQDILAKGTVLYEAPHR